MAEYKAMGGTDTSVDEVNLCNPGMNANTRRKVKELAEAKIE